MARVSVAQRVIPHALLAGLGLALCGTMALSGCAQSANSQQLLEQSPKDPFRAAPADFTLDILILPGAEVSPINRARHYCGRYVMLSDGSLHQASIGDSVIIINEVSGKARKHRRASNAAGNGDADQNAGNRDLELPDQVRRLSREQVAQVWSLAQQTGLAEPERSDPIVNINFTRPQPAQVAYYVGVRARDRYWNFVRAVDAHEAVDPSLGQFVQYIAQLAWVSDRYEPAGVMMPPHYNFGPDPYARFARPGSSTAPSESSK